MLREKRSSNSLSSFLITLHIGNYLGATSGISLRFILQSIDLPQITIIFTSRYNYTAHLKNTVDPAL